MGGDLGIAQEGERYASVVGRRGGIGEDASNLLVVRRPQEEGDLAHGFASQPLERGRLDLQDLFVLEGSDADPLAREQAVGRVVLAERKRILVGERWGDHGGHCACSKAVALEGTIRAVRIVCAMRKRRAIERHSATVGRSPCREWTARWSECFGRSWT